MLIESAACSQGTLGSPSIPRNSCAKRGSLCATLQRGRNRSVWAAVVLFGTEDTLTQLMPYFKIDALLRRQDVDRYDDRLLVRTNIVEAYLRLMEFIERHLPDPFYMSAMRA